MLPLCVSSIRSCALAYWQIPFYKALAINVFATLSPALFVLLSLFGHEVV